MASSQQLEVAKVGNSHSSSFLCQKCCQPLKLDTSFYAVDQRAFSELTGTLCGYLIVVKFLPPVAVVIISGWNTL